MNILGYSDKFSVQKNEELQIKVSCRNIKTYNANLVKIVQGDINEKGPGYKEKKIKPFNKFKPKLFNSASEKNHLLYFKSTLEFFLAGRFYSNPRYVDSGRLLLFRPKTI